MENTPPSLLVVQFKNQLRRSGRFWMKSAGSCFPNCQIFPWDFASSFSHGQPFKTHLPISSFSSSLLFLPNPIFTSSSCSFLGVFSFLEITSLTIMGMDKETQFHVLAVDDSLIDRKLIERLLKTSSYQVTAVDSGSKALEFLGLNNNNEDEQRNSNLASVSPDDDDDDDQDHQEVEVNLIITDYCMPGMTGYDLLRKIKESSSFKDIPVVIMSSDNIPSRINRCLEDGAEEFFLKPVQLSDVNKLRPHLMKGIRSKEMESNINKRKGIEEIHSPDRTRARYNELEVV